MIDIFKLAGKIQKQIQGELDKGVPDYTGRLGDQIIVASYRTMKLEDLERMRFILNKIIKKRKEGIRCADAAALHPDSSRSHPDVEKRR